MANPVYANPVVWSDRKRIIFGLPWTFTKYSLTKEKLYIETGVFNKDEEEIRLYRIMDLTLLRPLGQRMWGLGTIHCCTADKSTPEIDILHIPAPKEIRTLLSDKVEQARSERYVGVREYMGEDEEDSH